MAFPSCLLSIYVQNPDSLYIFSWLVPLTDPAVILIASRYTFSGIFESVPEQLSQTVFEVDEVH